jgi:hypothetical protein
MLLEMDDAALELMPIPSEMRLRLSRALDQLRAQAKVHPSAPAMGSRLIDCSPARQRDIRSRARTARRLLNRSHYGSDPEGLSMVLASWRRPHECSGSSISECIAVKTYFIDIEKSGQVPVVRLVPRDVSFRDLKDSLETEASRALQLFVMGTDLSLSLSVSPLLLLLVTKEQMQRTVSRT